MNSNSKLDTFASSILKAFFVYVPLEAFQSYLPEIFRIQFERLREMKSKADIYGVKLPFFQAQLCAIWSVLVKKHGGQLLIECMNTVQVNKTHTQQSNVKRILSLTLSLPLILVCSFLASRDACLCEPAFFSR